MPGSLATSKWATIWITATPGAGKRCSVDFAIAVEQPLVKMRAFTNAATARFCGDNACGARDLLRNARAGSNLRLNDETDSFRPRASALERL